MTLWITPRIIRQSKSVFFNVHAAHIQHVHC